jgi:hypothetical protein
VSSSAARRTRATEVGWVSREEAAILLELLINAGFGLLFAQCARERVRADGPFASPAFPLVMMFFGLIAMPTSLYLYWAHPAWSWMYLLDPRHVPAIMVVPVVVVQLGTLMGAWLLGAALIRADKDRVLLTALLGMVAVLAGLGLLLSERIGAYGSFQVFAAGAAVGLLEVKLGYVLIAILLGLGAAAAFVAVELLRDGRRARLR